jgi:hypothetical protein
MRFHAFHALYIPLSKAGDIHFLNHLKNKIKNKIKFAPLLYDQKVSHISFLLPPIDPI